MTIYPFHWLMADASGTSILVFGGWWDSGSANSPGASRTVLLVGAGFGLGIGF